MNNFTIEENGLKCGSCHWKDSRIPTKDFHLWVNKPCPSCNKTVVTESDYALFLETMATFEKLNKMSPEEIVKMDKLFPGSDFSLLGMSLESSVSGRITIHDGLSVDNLKLGLEHYPKNEKE